MEQAVSRPLCDDKKLSVLQVTAWDHMGRPFNGYNLHRALMQRGHESHLAALNTRMGEAHILRLGSLLARQADYRVFNPLERLLSLQSVLPQVGDSLLTLPAFRKADVVHLQLIHSQSFLRLSLLPEISHRKPTVWTIHDPWIVTGHCIHPLDCPAWMTGCASCPRLDAPLALRRDTAAFHWRLKKRMLSRSPVTLVAASPWMADMLARSPLTAHLPCHVIPFGVDTDIFTPGDLKKSRQRFGIPPGAPVVAFRYRGLADPHKGGAMLKHALAALHHKGPVYLLVVEGHPDLFPLDPRFVVAHQGRVYTDRLMADLLRAADVFLMPSLAESFGMMAVEAMACGAVPLVSDGTALPSVVQAPEAGVSVPAGNGDALARSLERLLTDTVLRTAHRHACIDLVAAQYRQTTCVDRHIELYRSLRG